MPRKSTKAEVVEQTNIEVKQVEQTNEAQSLPPNKDDYVKTRATIKQYRESQKSKPKRPCSERQLAVLAQGRMKNKRFQKKLEETK